MTYRWTLTGKLSVIHWGQKILAWGEVWDELSWDEWTKFAANISVRTLTRSNMQVTEGKAYISHYPEKGQQDPCERTTMNIHK